jgi:hypothetical protein
MRSFALRTLLAIVLVLSLIACQEYRYHVYAVPRSAFYLLMVFLAIVGLIISLWSDAVRQMYIWWKGLTWGRYTVARIVNVQRTRKHYGDALEGQWRITVDNRVCIEHFLLDGFLSGSWIWDLDADSDVHVIIHPKEPHVLVAIGIVNEYTPQINPPTETSLSTELLEQRPPNDSISTE